MRVLLSIKPEYVDRIFSGEKRYEFRKTSFSRAVSCAVVYATYPVGLVVGEFEVGTILESDPTEIWARTQKSAGISKDLYFKYFSGRVKAVAIQIKKVHRYREAVNPYKRCKNFIAPQSFRYLDDASTCKQISFLNCCPA